MAETLSQSQLDGFIRDGFVRVDGAFSPDLARKVRERLWQDMDAKSGDPSTWTQPVIRLGMYSEAPFLEAANTDRLHRAFDQLVGKGQWRPCRSMGTFPVRFPSNEDPGDTGWHVDSGFPGADPADFFSWRVNVRSRGRALLMLFLFSDVGEADAPTRIRTGSHLDVARVLAPAEEDGLSFLELAETLESMPERPEVQAIGEAGTVYLCHPFLAHASQAHRGTEPRFLAQPPLFLRDPELEAPADVASLFRPALRLEGPDDTLSPVEAAIRLALRTPPQP